MKNNLKKSLLAGAIGAALIMSSASYAGNDNGAMKGLIVDGKNTAVVGAVITVKNASNGFTRSVTVKEDGTYRLSALPVGYYTVTITKDGFESFEQKNVRIQIGTTNLDAPIYRSGQDMEVIEVRGSTVATIDVTSSESALNIGDVELARLPVARDITSVALLAPGTSRGDSRFGNLASFGGSSVAENAYFVNGLNVTNFRNGLGGSTIPFEFYKEFQVKTGGYSAEFGRSTGGVINAVTKSGSNEWKYGANVYYSPKSLRESNPNSLRLDGTMKTFNEKDTYNKVDGNVYLSGPIIKDTLFFYVLYNPRNIDQEYVTGGGSQFNSSSSNDAFWGGKIDWNIMEDHLLEVTAFSDQRTTTTTTFDYDFKTGQKTLNPGASLANRGGENISVKYTGYITDDFTISALWGKNKADLTDSSPNDLDCPAIGDSRQGGFTSLGCWSTFAPSAGEDTREAFRIDGEWTLGDHNLRFGMDNEKNTSIDLTFYSGHNYYRYFAFDAGDRIGSIGHTFTEATEVVRHRVLERGGSFDTESNAFYLEDTWYVTDDITATIGIRNESFDNKNAAGASFIKVDNQWAPRLGISWDVNGDGESKIFANFGRYHLPIAANTNIRMAGAELFTQDWFILEGVNSDDTPVIGAKLGGSIFGDGTVPDPAEVLDTSTKPMFQDEYILGYQTLLNDDWSVGVKVTYRDLKSIIDDITIDKAIRANGWDWNGSNIYVLTNPGSDITVSYDTDGDGTLEVVNINGADLGYPDPKRKYVSWEFSLDKAWDDVWSLSATYTWAHSFGNAEGYVKSDNGQDDAGLTTDWDFPYLMHGANGNLPNDRRHTFKAFGSYAVTEDFLVGANLLIQSGRPINGFGENIPTDFANANNEVYAYGQTYFIGDQFVPRGSFGRTPWIVQLDLTLKYNMVISDTDVTFQADIFNVFNAQSVTRFEENAENGGASNEFLTPNTYQTPRYVQLSASVRF
ncbi:MAG: TonB-dependent receptor [Gammaproteobacteria bacterium]|nr:MAG: TonB-dependent receptor [Gammaproteobacteria bacterium]